MLRACPENRIAYLQVALMWLAVGCDSECNLPVAPDSDGVQHCGPDYVGDPEIPPQFTATSLGPTMIPAALADGGVVSLIAPPQGGRVVFIGVQGATNLEPCGVTLLAAVRDIRSGQVRLDSRTLNLVVGQDGKGASLESDISTFANVPLCPNQWSHDAIFDRDYEVTVSLTDRQGRSAAQRFLIRPTCNLPEEAMVCQCLCKKDYKLGESCLGNPSKDGGI